MKQLAFDFSVVPPPTLENFVSARNAELAQKLQRLDSADRDERILYLWGPPGSGRTHLLLATLTRLEASGSRVAYVACAPHSEFSESLRDVDALGVDDVDQLNEHAQVSFFNLYNSFRDGGKTLIAAGSVPPMRLSLRADVATRLGWSLVYEVHALTDVDKMAALAEHAAARGFALQPEVIEYLFTRVRRDMPTLLGVLDALDRYSLAAKRAITVPLLRELLSTLEA